VNTDNLFQDATLFKVEKVKPISLSDKFIVPPFSVLDRRNGDWQNRRRRWMQLGIQSEIGRGENLAFKGQDTLNDITDDAKQGTSIFDPVICEVALRWFSAVGDKVIDPFAGGSVRGVVASHLERHYVGYDLRQEQVNSNIDQIHLANNNFKPSWHQGDATTADFGSGFDMVFTCPPYADLEIYSNDPSDLSTMTYTDFINAYRKALENAVVSLKEDRFIVIVIGDARTKKGDGHYYGLVSDTIQIMKSNLGCELYNDLIIVDPVGTLAVRSERQMRASRKVGRGHQQMLVFVKGNGRKASEHCGEI